MNTHEGTRALLLMLAGGNAVSIFTALSNQQMGWSLIHLVTAYFCFRVAGGFQGVKQ